MFPETSIDNKFYSTFKNLIIIDEIQIPLNPSSDSVVLIF